MLPLCTSVTLADFRATAWSSALRKTNGLDSHLTPEKIDDAPCVVSPGLVLDAGVDVLGVLAEDDHLHVLRRLDRRRHALEPAHRADAGIEIELLAERHVERAEAAADRRRQRPLDGHQMLVDGCQGLVGQPAVEPVLGLLAGEDLAPDDAPLVAVRPPDGRVEDVLRGAPDVRPGAVALDEGNHRLARYLEPPVAHGDDIAQGGDCHERIPSNGSG